MARDLLWLEMLLKAISGGLLLLFPRTLARLLGLPPVAETFWPRLLGAMLLGLAAATLLEVRLDARNGLGLAGHVVINLGMALTLFGLLIMAKAAPARRGRILVGVFAAALTVLALFELAWI
jgi:hypothetical protein